MAKADVIEIEGKLSLNDKMEDVLKTFKGKLWFFKLLLIMGKKMNEASSKQPKAKTKKKKNNTSLDNKTMDLIKSFTVLRFTSLVAMRNVNFTKEELLKFNSQLNKIDKKK